MAIEYEKGSRYPHPSEEPPTDAMGLFLEGIPVFKIWFTPPIDFESDCLDGLCTYIGLVPASKFPGGLPFFVFQNPAEEVFVVKAPLGATRQQVDHWASADSNAFMFVLIERGTSIIRQIRIIGVPPNYRAELAKTWRANIEFVDRQKANAQLGSMTDNEIFRAAKVWAYSPETDLFEAS